MEIQQHVEIEEESIGDMGEIQSSIRSEDLGFALSAVSKNLYANNIGSFIRELVSNGVDANVDNENRTKSVAVEVKLYKEGEEWWFSVQDFGTGMTEKVFTEVYMAWFNSDKRKTNSKIGGWGLGSKSPLSYVDQYELTTIAEGIKYEYIIAKSGTVPMATPLLAKETTEPSGTIVKFIVKQKDLYKISDELNKQLSYFNEVVVINEYMYYTNEFIVLESEHFKYRPDKHSFGSEMHLVIGQVPYKIDFNLLKRDRIYMPLAIKFDIGSLPVTLSREDINYDDEFIDVIQNINDKIDIVLEDLSTRYAAFINFTDLREYLQFVNRDKNYLMLGEHKLIIDNNIIKNKAKLLIDDVVYTFTKDQTLDLLHQILYFNHVNLTTLGKIRNHIPSLLRILDNPEDFVYKREDANHWSNKYHEGKTAILETKYNARKLLYFAEKVGLDVTEYGKFGKKKRVFKPGGTRVAYNLLKFIRNSVKNSVASYDYVPRSFIEADKIAQKEISAAKKGSITSYDADGYMTQYDVETILSTYNHIFYIDRKEDIYKIAYYNMLYNTLPKYFKKKLLFLHLNPTTIKGIKKYKNQVHNITRIWEFKVLKNYYNRLPILIKLSELNEEGYETIEKFSPYYAKELRKTKQHYTDRDGKRYGTIDIKSILVRDLENKQTVEITPNNFLNYFEEQLKKTKANKSFLYKDLIDEVHGLLPLIRARKAIADSYIKDKNGSYEYIVNSLHITKINRTLN